MTADQWFERLVLHGVPCMKVAEDNIDGFYNNPQAIESGIIYEGHHLHYTGLKQPGVLVHFSKTPTVNNAAAAVIGQHTSEVLLEIGYTKSQINTMLHKGIIAVAES